MKQQYATDVLICGAGAAGLTLAIELARRGIACRLIEKNVSPFPGSRGKGLQPRTLEMFADLGVADRIAASGGVYPPVRRYHADGSISDAEIVEPLAMTPDVPYPLPLMVPQFKTERVLRERLCELGGSVEFACELVDFAEDADGVTVRLARPSGEETLRVRWLVGADGGRSTVRRALNIDFPGKTLGARALVADVVLTGLTRDVWHRFGDGDPTRQVLLCPLAGTDLFQIQGPLAEDAEADLSSAGLQALVTTRTGRDDIRITSVCWSSAYTMNARLAARYRLGRALLVGDAAHIHPPTGGQGLNTSVQDAVNLGWKLAAVIAGAPEALLDSYEEERRPVAAAMLGLSTRLLDAARQGEIRRGREVQQLDIGYRGSSLALTGPRPSTGLQAGDRAPDAPIGGAAGQPGRLFSLLHGPHWTLIGYHTARGDVLPRKGLHIHTFGAEGDLSDEQGHFVDAWALAPGEWVLVRPDGYIAAIVSQQQHPALEAYLAQVGLAR